MKKPFILWFKDLCIKDVGKVGGKNASLGEMYRQLMKKGVFVPNGFAITAYAYEHFILSAGIKDKIEKILKKGNIRDIKSLQAMGGSIRALIRNAPMSDDLEQEIFSAYQKLSAQYFNNVDVAVRSSATAEDLPDASFAGQQETYLNIRGKKQLIEACKKCFASLFTNRAISYREHKGFDHFKVALSIGVQKMVRSDKACSGVMFSIDTETGFKNAVFITGSYGLGENVVQGTVNPDEYYVFKPTLQKYKPILSKQLGDKKLKMVYASGSKNTKNVSVPQKQRQSYVLLDKEIMQLARWAVIIENYYGKPMDMEWAKDGESGTLYIVQARPETIQSQKKQTLLEQYILKKKGKVLTVGRSVGEKIGQGRVHIIKNVKDIHKFKKGEILVTDITDPDWEPIMKIASAIVTNKGGRTSHAAIVSRELGLPCVVGTRTATEDVKNGSPVTVSCAEGEEGFVYKGLLPFRKKITDLKKIPKLKTKIMLNLGNPEQAFSLASLPVCGIGLAREEFIINAYIKIHPRALLLFHKIKDGKIKQKIQSLTAHYKNKTQFFIDKLAEGISMLAAAFYPDDVIVRLSDFKSNEYANLIGGHLYEPHEENPMIGWRGASRYYSKSYRDAFQMECKALKKVRDEMGLHNVKVMVPFCRTPAEGKSVVKEMARAGLKRGKNGLEIYVMCEIPSNVIDGDAFSQVFDGFSIGTNDLTQLTLGLDRDSALVSHIYDERNPAVKQLVASIIKTAKKHKKKIGICGDAPSTYPEFAAFLADQHIDSISLTPDAVLGTIMSLAKHAKKNKKKKVRKKV